jgi:hypothetical protein
MAPIPSPGGLQGHCYNTGLEVMFITCVHISTESCELLATINGGREKLAILDRKLNDFWGTHR